MFKSLVILATANSRNSSLQISPYNGFIFIHREVGEEERKLENLYYHSVSFIPNFCAGIKWGIYSDCNILLCWISERLRLVNSSEESITLLMGSNGNAEQSEQKPSYFNKQIWLAHSVTADARRKYSVNVSDGYVITWVIW